MHRAARPLGVHIYVSVYPQASGNCQNLNSSKGKGSQKWKETPGLEWKRNGDTSNRSQITNFIWPAPSLRGQVYVMHVSSQAPRAEHLRDGDAKFPGDHAGACTINHGQEGPHTWPPRRCACLNTKGSSWCSTTAAKALLLWHRPW